MTKKDKKDFQILINHAEIDLSYDENGSYGHKTGIFEILNQRIMSPIEF